MKTRWLVAAGVACLVLVATLVDGILQPATVQAEDSGWLGQYYSNRWLNGSPTVVRADDAIDFDWGAGSPDDLIPSDDFSVRWTRNVDFEDGTYRFTMTSDDGVRLYVDDTLLLDCWYDMTSDDHSAEIDLSAGTHVLRLEYYENEGDALVELSWDQVDDSDTPVGNIVTCAPLGPVALSHLTQHGFEGRPENSWIKVYRWDGSIWIDVKPDGYGPLSASGYLKLDGMYVDTATYGAAGHPYRVELWANGSLIAAVGDTATGQPEFRVYADTDNITPWACPAA